MDMNKKGFLSRYRYNNTINVIASFLFALIPEKHSQFESCKNYCRGEFDFTFPARLSFKAKINNSGLHWSVISFSKRDEICMERMHSRE